MSFATQSMRYCFCTSARESLNVYRTPPNLGQITRQRIRMNVIGVFDYFQTCTFPRSVDHLCVSASIRIDKIMLMVDSSVHVRLPVRNPTRYVSVSTPFICPDFSTRKNVSQDNGSQSAFVSSENVKHSNFCGSTCTLNRLIAIPETHGPSV